MVNFTPEGIHLVPVPGIKIGLQALNATPLCGIQTTPSKAKRSIKAWLIDWQGIKLNGEEQGIVDNSCIETQVFDG